MRCHYEVLGVASDAGEDDLKKSYRKLALKWHPDKNRGREEEATAQFRLVQQAYEVLSDRQERAWYDRHRERILAGGFDSDYKDNCLNVFQYFTASCYSGYGDDDNGFYAVYREVFKTLAAEDSEFAKEGDSDYEIPEFGDSQSVFEEVVGPFYAHWSAYCTRRSYTWLDKYDIRQAENRWMLRQMERENKKIHDKARKERNDEVRALVAYVRKRDRRVAAQQRRLQERAAEHARRAQELAEQQRLQRHRQREAYTEAEWAGGAEHELRLREAEAAMARQFGEQVSASGDSSDDQPPPPDHLYCPACDKTFKTDKSYKNHEVSKKHRENVLKLRQLMREEEEQTVNGHAESQSDNQSSATDDKTGATDGQPSATNGCSIATDDESLATESEPPEHQRIGQPAAQSSDDSSPVEPSALTSRSRRQRRRRRPVAPLFADSAGLVDSDESDSGDGVERTAAALAAARLSHPVSDDTDDAATAADDTAAAADDTARAADDAVAAADDAATAADDAAKAAGTADVRAVRLKGKKAKEARRKARTAQQQQQSAEASAGIAPESTCSVCQVCQTQFQSKNKLFEHIRKTRHAALKTAPAAAAPPPPPADGRKTRRKR